MTEGYPNGFAKEPPSQMVVMQSGRYSRYGGIIGRYLAPLGTPFENLGLPYEYDRDLDPIIEIKEPIKVTAGAIQSDFGSKLGSIQ